MARILVADGSMFMLGSLKYLVEHAGHVVVGTAKNGREALDLCKRLKPDMALLDVNLDGMGDYSLLKSIVREKVSGAVVMVWPPGQEGLHEEARANGAAGHIMKPFKLEQITMELKRVSKSAH